MKTSQKSVVLHGTSTLIISLPVKWTKKNNVHKGDKISVTENENMLYVCANGNTEKEVRKLIIRENFMRQYGKQFQKYLSDLEKKVPYLYKPTFNLDLVIK